MRSLLVDVSPGDPLTLVLAVVVLTGAAMLACYLPARRASRTNPLRTLPGD